MLDQNSLSFKFINPYFIAEKLVDGNIWKFGTTMIYAQITISTALKIIKIFVMDEHRAKGSDIKLLIVFKEEGNRK